MIFDRNENKEVIALLGAGSMGTAIIRRFAAGRKSCWETSAKRTWKRLPMSLRIADMMWKPALWTH